jgi:aminopeptidase YwaD
MRKLLLLLLILNGGFTFCQIEEVRRITHQLCSPELHGRGYVSKGDSLAAEFIAADFSKIGLKPIGDSYFQEFQHSVNTFPGKMLVKQDNRTLVPGVHFLVDAGSAGAKMQLKPKRIPISIALNTEKLIQEIQAISNGTTYNSIAFDFRKLTADTLRKISGLTREIAGILPVIEVTDRKLTWSVSSEQLKHPLLQIQDSVFVFDEELTIDIEAEQLTDYRSRNVIGYLPGKRKWGKKVIYSAHYDHLGRMGEETYFPGANDNASGTAMLLSMANYFKQNPIKRSIVFIAFAGEEAGLVGSKYFVGNPLVKLKKISFVLNLDIMGSGEEGITVVNATLFDSEFKALQKINQEQKLISHIKSRGPAANSDHYWFTQMNVPAFFIYTMGPNKNYHDIFDTYENLSFVEYQDLVALLCAFTKQL